MVTTSVHVTPRATNNIYVLSLHDALPISGPSAASAETCASVDSWTQGTVPRLPSCRRSRRARSEEHTSELQSLTKIVCRLLLEKKKRQCLAGGPPGWESTRAPTVRAACLH